MPFIWWIKIINNADTIITAQYSWYVILAEPLPEFIYFTWSSSTERL